MKNISNIKKLKDTFEKFNELIDKTFKTRFKCVNLNKSAPSQNFYYGYTKKGVAHDFVRKYDNGNDDFVFLFDGNIFSDDLRISLVHNHIQTDYMKFEAFKTSFKKYVKFASDALDMKMDIDHNVLINKFFDFGKDVDLIKVVEDTINFDKHKTSLDKIIFEIENRKNDFENAKSDARDKLLKSAEYKKVEDLKAELKKAKENLNKKSDKLSAGANAIKNDLAKFKGLYNKDKAKYYTAVDKAVGLLDVNNIMKNKLKNIFKNLYK